MRLQRRWRPHGREAERATPRETFEEGKAKLMALAAEAEGIEPTKIASKDDAD
jgi:hypothetical protein